MLPRLAVFASVLVVILIGGCSSRLPPEVPLAKARNWHKAVNGRIERVWPTFDHRNFLNSLDPEVTHVVQVLVLDAEQPETRYLFPYDAWSLNKEPPAPGTELVFTPATWVTPGRHSKGLPNPIHEQP